QGYVGHVDTASGLELDIDSPAGATFAGRDQVQNRGDLTGRGILDGIFRVAFVFERFDGEIDKITYVTVVAHGLTVAPDCETGSLGGAREQRWHDCEATRGMLPWPINVTGPQHDSLPSRGHGACMDKHFRGGLAGSVVRSRS